MDDDAVDLGIDDLTGAVEVGAGGFGTVYKAHQESLRRDVAVKVVSSTVKDEKVRIRFEREIQAMGMLSGHPNIVTVYDSGFTAGGQPYILMGFMEEGSLGDRLDARGPLPYADVLTMMVKVCGALETAHQAGILHRDIKPENVLVSAYGEPKLGDFGIARLKGGPETGTSSLTASIEHVSPELLEAKAPSAASDVYALGSTMFKLLTGTAAFVRPEDESIVPALTRIRDEPVPDLRARGIPAPVADVVERAMAKDPAQRYSSAAAMGQALQQAQRLVGLPETTLPVRAEEAAAARESTRTINSDDLARSIEDIRAGTGGAPPIAPTGRPVGPVGHAGPGAPALPTGPGIAAGAPVPPQPVGPARTAPQPPAPGAPYVSGPQGQPVPAGAPPAYAGGFGGPPTASGPTPTGSGGSSPWLKVGLALTGLAVIAAVGVAVALSGGDEPELPPDPPERTTEPDAPDPPEDLPAYAGYEQLVDGTGTITVTVPEEWDDINRGPWVIDGEEVGQQIEAAPDLDAFRGTWTTPGVIFGVSDRLREAFTPEELLDALDFGDQCDDAGREAYTDPAYEGLRQDYTGCGGTDTSYTIIAAEPPEQDYLVLVQFQHVSDRDDAALDRVIETFFRPDPEDAGAAGGATEGG